MMKNSILIPRLRAAAVCLLAFECSRGILAQAAFLTVEPASIDPNTANPITISITGLVEGQRVVLRKFLDHNGNGLVDASDVLVQAVRLQDGVASSIGGVRYQSVPGDEDGIVDGSINSAIDFKGQSEINRAIGRYVYEVSPEPSGFTPVAAPFAVTAAAHAQQVTGQVTDEGSPIPRAFAFLLHNGQGRPVLSTITDSEGRFTLPCPEGNYVVGALAEGYLTDFDSTPFVSVAAGASVSQDLTITAADRTISGRVVDADSAEGIPAVQMIAQSDSGLTTLVFGDEDGRFTIPVSSSSTQWELDVSDRDAMLHGMVHTEAVAVETSGSDLTGVEIALPRATAMVFGQLRNQSSEPIPGVEVYSDYQSYDSIGMTRSDGLYTVGVIPGQWGVEPNSESLSALGYAASEVSVVVSLGQAIQVDFTAVAFSAHLRGRAQDDSGAPLGGAPLRARSQSGGSSETITDPDGSFDLGVSAGNWTLEMSGSEAIDRGLVRSYYMFDIIDGVDHNNITYVAPRRTAQIICSVRDTQGNPVAGVNVWSLAAVGGVSYNPSLDTDLTGTSRLNAINGNWMVHVYEGDLATQGYAPVAGQSVLVSGSDASVLFLVQQAVPPEITTTSLPNATVGIFYYEILAVSGGQTPYSWSLAPGSGSLPPGIDLASGALRGTPSAAGPYSFTVRVTDAFSNYSEKTLSLTVTALDLVMDTTDLPMAGVGTFYSQDLSASGGQAPYSWSLAPGSGPLPAGFELASSGNLWGTASVAATFEFVLRVTDSGGSHVDRTFSLTVTGGDARLSNVELLPDRQFRFRIESLHAETCSVEVSTDLVEWSSLGPGVAEGNGNWTFTDVDASGQDIRFYRVVAPR